MKFKVPQEVNLKQGENFIKKGSRIKGNIAVDATLRAAVKRQAGEITNHKRILISKEDLREKIRRHHSPYLINFVVDNSWSTHMETTLKQVKGIALKFLEDAASKHDRISMITFSHSRNPQGVLILPPTSSLQMAYRRLKEIPLSGSTPLPHAMQSASRVLKKEYYKKPNAVPVLVLITDGISTVPYHPGEDPYHEMLELSRAFRKEPFLVLVVDISSKKETKHNYCKEIATLAGGRYLHISDLTLSTLKENISGGIS